LKRVDVSVQYFGTLIFGDKILTGKCYSVPSYQGSLDAESHKMDAAMVESCSY